MLLSNFSEKQSFAVELSTGGRQTHVLPLCNWCCNMGENQPSLTCYENRAAPKKERVCESKKRRRRTQRIKKIEPKESREVADSENQKQQGKSTKKTEC